MELVSWTIASPITSRSKFAAAVRRELLGGSTCTILYAYKRFIQYIISKTAINAIAMHPHAVTVAIDSYMIQLSISYPQTLIPLHRRY